MALAVSSRSFVSPLALSRKRAQQRTARAAGSRAPITHVAPRAYYGAGGCYGGNPGGYASSEQARRIMREFMKQVQEQGGASISWPGGRVWLGADMKSWDDEMEARAGRDADTAAHQPAPWKLAVDVQKQDDAYILMADVPGVTKEDLTIKLVPPTKTPSGKQQAPALSIKGTRKAAPQHPLAGEAAAKEGADATDDASLLLKERKRGGFERQVTLPDDAANTGISARVKDGVLTVRIPRVQQPEQQESEIPIA